jgi:hypothetical protein
MLHTFVSTRRVIDMKFILKVALALILFTSPLTAFAQSQPPATKSSNAPKAKARMHDGCHSRAAQMAGKPCR